MTWFMQQRQDFIRAQLQTFGMIRRADIAARFEVTIQVASADVQTFIAAHPDAIDYDRSAKCYTYDRQDALAPTRPGSCILCAGKCRGHGLADPVAWEPEVGSVAALARAKAGVGGA
jgi:hypothetical protein